MWMDFECETSLLPKTSEARHHFFLFCVELHSLQSSSARNQEPSSRGALNSGLPSADSGLQLDLGDRAKRCLSEDRLGSRKDARESAKSPDDHCPDKLTPQLQESTPSPCGFISRQGASRNNLRGPMENARVERRQFHSMSFGQFGKVQIGKLSARFRGDSLR